MGFQQRYRQAGATLLEVLIAMLLMSVGALAMSTMQAHAIHFSQGSEWRAKATLLTHDLGDRMRANATTPDKAAAYAVTFDQPADNQAPSCQGSTPCNFAEMAEADVREWRQRLATSLPQGRGHIEPLDHRIDLWVIWEEPDTGSAQAQDACPAHVIHTPQTRCFYTQLTL